MFTESWLQALTLSTSAPAARTVKPLLSDIDLLCQSRNVEERPAAAERVWDMAAQFDLIPLLSLVPTSRPVWHFYDEELFVFHNRSSLDSASQSPDASESTRVFTDKLSWQAAIGVIPSEFSLDGVVTAGDWADLLRDEAVRQRRPMSMNAFVNDQKGTVTQPCTARFDSGNWTIRFNNADWITREYDDAFSTSRISTEQVVDMAVESLVSCDNSLLPRSSPKDFVDTEQPWLDSVESLAELHHQALQGKSAIGNAWQRKAWGCVWPVIYREQNKLSQPCDLGKLRLELADCFQNVPQLTIRTFALAKLICTAQIRSGLGVCGDFSNNAHQS
jgi:hypothetical protein